jgi:hypothetical protein
VSETDKARKTRRRRFRLLLNDAFAFVRSVEVNRALQGVGWEELMSEQIARNGDTESSNKRKHNPYSYDPLGTKISGEVAPTVETYGPDGNFISGTNIANPTKMDRVFALQSEIEGAVTTLMNTDPDFLVDSKDKAAEESEAPLPDQASDDDYTAQLRSEGYSDAQIVEILLFENGQ